MRPLYESVKEDKSEADKMCKYCETPPGVEVVCSLTARGTYNAFNENKEEWHKVKYSTEICFNKKMNYCPMCGRKLGELNDR